MMQHLFGKPRMLRRIIVLAISTVAMGFGVAVFQQMAFGSDPCALTTQGLHRMSGIGYGTCMAIVNLVILLAVFAMREFKCIGLGMLANMFVVGYVVEFFNFIFDSFCPLIDLSMVMKVVVFLPSMAIFLVAVAFYTTVNLGVAPYDALPLTVAARLKLPFSAVRMAWDILFTVIGCLLGGTLGIVTLFVCFFMGPVISWISAKFKWIFE